METRILIYEEQGDWRPTAHQSASVDAVIEIREGGVPYMHKARTEAAGKAALAAARVLAGNTD